MLPRAWRQRRTGPHFVKNELFAGIASCDKDHNCTVQKVPTQLQAAHAAAAQLVLRHFSASESSNELLMPTRWVGKHRDGQQPEGIQCLSLSMHTVHTKHADSIATMSAREVSRTC